MIARHPLAASILALLALTWVNLGWVGIIGLAAWVVVVLAAWRFFWPSSFTRWVDRTGAGQVAGLVLPAPLGRGDDDRRPGPAVPGPHPAARPGQGHRDPVHRPGAGPAGLRPVRGRLRQAGGEPGARVRRAAVPGPHRQVRGGAAGVRPPRRPGRHRPRPPGPRPPRPHKRSRSGGAKTGCRGWSSCTARMS